MYLEILDDDINKVKKVLNSENILILDIFDSVYEKMCKEEIKYYMENVVQYNGGYLSDSDLENKIFELTEEDRHILIDRATNLMCNNEYMSEIVTESTTDALEESLKALFVKVEE